MGDEESATARARAEGRAEGRSEGEVIARLAGHDRHFEQINGSIARMGDELHNLNMLIQQIRDEARSRDKTAEAATHAVTSHEEKKWARYQRAFTFIAAVAALVTIVSVVFTLVRR